MKIISNSWPQTKERNINRKVGKNGCGICEEKMNQTYRHVKSPVERYQYRKAERKMRKI